MMRFRRAAPGFSIVELMVATLIAMVVFGLGFTIINKITQARTQTAARVRASENARLFFQLLEKDLAAANPGPHNMVKDRTLVPGYPCAAPQATVLEEDLGGGVYADILQFYTRADAATVTDEYVFVRYFVNRANNTICRHVIAVPNSDESIAPELTENPLPYTNDAAIVQFALFDEVKSFYVVHRIWNETNKALTPTGLQDYQEADPATIQNATHLRVMLVMRYSVDGGTTFLERTFSKVLELPWRAGS